MGKLILDTILARLDVLEAATLGRPRRRLSKSALATEEDCSPRQVMRKVEQGLLPRPDDVINKRLFWWSDSVERHRKSKRSKTVDTAAAKAARDPRLRARKPAHSSLDT